MNLDENFNQQEFTDWIEEFLPDFSRDIRKVDVPGGFTGVKSINTLGVSGLNVRVYIIETDTDPSKRKIGLASDSFSLLKNYGSPNAIIAYYSKDEPLWRISLLTSIPIWNEGKIITKLSNPKRQSYVLGSRAKIKTPYQFLLSKGKVIDFTDLKNRFSLEVVNKEFYKEISQAFTKLVGGSVAIGKSKKTFEPLLKLPSLQDRSQTNLEFAVRLIGRIIFCWFLREKRSETGHSLIPKQLVSFDAANNTRDYYHKILEPIFFEILNKPIRSRKENFIDDLFSAIPYLNGGLFSPHEDDFFNYSEEKQTINHNTVVIPDEWLKSFFEVLETYNFTIDENTSFDEELSIDPEMLGRIFENLLAEINPETGESARKSTGSYYTPRIIVDYMIDESLLLYLKEKTGVEEKELRSLISYDLEDDKSNPLSEDEKDKIARSLSIIKILDPACGSGAFPIGALQKIVFILQQIDQNGQLWFKKQIQNTPVELRKAIEREFQEKNFDYIRKLGIIRENIYGIDIQPIATEISRLRCFLTLVVDQSVKDDEENRGVEPLPNLDFKFVTANSLISLPKMREDQLELFDDRAKIEQLKALRDQYFTARNEERKDIMIAFSELQSEMINELIDEHSFTGASKAELTRKLTDWKPFKHKSTDWFDSEWMFGIKDGFDIVIANPPYVGHKGGQKSLFRYLKNTELGKKFNNERMDLFYYFFHLSLDISKENGIIAFITTNYYLTADSAKKLRNDFKKRAVISELINFNELKIFDSAQGQHSILTFIQKRLDENLICFTSYTRREGLVTDEILKQILDKNDSLTVYGNLYQKYLYDGQNNYIRIFSEFDEQQKVINGILTKVASQGDILSNLCNISQGIVSGIDKISKKHIRKDQSLRRDDGAGVYVLNNDESENIGSSSLIKPWFKNSDIQKYYANEENTHWIIHTHSELDLDKYPNIKKHLQKFQKIIESRNYESGELSKAKRLNAWWAMSSSRKDFDFKQPKIISPQRSFSNTFAYTEKEWLASADVYFITSINEDYSLKYILALINSKLYYLWLYHKGKRKGEMLELYLTPLSEIPIKKIHNQKPFIEIVDKILTITSSTDYLTNSEKQVKVEDYEKQIDQLVYKLYGLTEDERRIVEDKND